ncbi:MAG: tetratricopeptide repeat protein [Candidatus Manganitrophus sp.]|nr:tetratricopeptide repeat protein [Candidatus Manganitrophus sp.]MDC4225027.1 tetratricopeptide repeat protein [Candidatus Manganitrophus sp.]WDT71709.1 MAG: tetratricopeptide repeat protein [Candidatus Manganitrophus sp.]WDT80927.1 MAG: tetratricopeptide repeat protein [Candidatus Manganitrophus sp.]
MPHKIRVQKKRDEAPLRLVTRSEELVEQVRSNPKWIWGGMGVALALIAIFITGWFLNQRAEKKAAAIEAEAFRLFHEPPPLPQPIEEGKPEPEPDIMDKTERLKKSASLYDEIVEKHSRTDVARMAPYESGNVYFELKDYDAAEKRYLAFLEKNAAQKNLASLAHLKLGYLYQKKGNPESALKHFRASYEVEGGNSRDQAGFELARALEISDKKNEAVEIYKKVSEDFEKSPWGVEAKVRMDILNPPTASTPAPSTTEPAKGTTPPAGASAPAETGKK